jgi:predicted nuclease of predicted toxin-antitoxin system
MTVRIKLDEDLSAMVGEPLLNAGHPVATVLGQGWGGLKDPELWPRVVSEGRFFVTADTGFGDIRVYPPGSHPGILVLRPDHESIVAYQALIAQVIRKHKLESLVGYITVATPRGVRVRRKPTTD